MANYVHRYIHVPLVSTAAFPSSHDDDDELKTRLVGRKYRGPRVKTAGRTFGRDDPDIFGAGSFTGDGKTLLSGRPRRLEYNPNVRTARREHRTDPERRSLLSSSRSTIRTPDMVGYDAIVSGRPEISVRIGR